MSLSKKQIHRYEERLNDPNFKGDKVWLYKKLESIRGTRSDLKKLNAKIRITQQSTVNVTVPISQKEKQINIYKARLADPNFKGDKQWLMNKIQEFKMNKPSRSDNQRPVKQKLISPKTRWSKPYTTKGVISSKHDPRYGKLNETHQYKGVAAEKWYGKNKVILNAINYNNSFQSDPNRANETLYAAEIRRYMNDGKGFYGGFAAGIIPSKEFFKNDRRLAPFAAITAGYEKDFGKKGKLSLNATYTPSVEFPEGRSPEVKSLNIGYSIDF